MVTMTSASLLHLSLVVLWAGIVLCEQVDMTHQFTSLVELQKVKERIMKGLNRSIQPLPMQPKARNLNTDSIKIPRWEIINNPTFNILKIWSEAKDSQKTSAMNFNMATVMEHNQSELASVNLIVVLRTERNSKRKSAGTTPKGTSSALPTPAGKKSNKAERTRKSKGEISDEKSKSSGDKDLERSAEAISEGADQDSRSRPLKTSTDRSPGGSQGKNIVKRSTASALKEKRRRRRKRKNRKNRQKSRSKKRSVKIVLRHLDPSTGRKKRVATKRVTFVRRIAVKIPLSLKLLRPESFTDNGTLTLFMSCKRCRQAVQLEHVYRKRKQTRKKGRSLNPNRPFLVVETRTEPHHRSPRHAILPTERSIPKMIKSWFSKAPKDDLKNLGHVKSLRFNLRLK